MENKKIEKFRVIGIAVRTSYDIENSIKRKIPLLWQRFYEERCFDKIPNKAESTKIYAIYSEYNPDEFGEFTFVLGMEVSDFSHIPEGMIGKTISSANYQVHESEQGPFAEVAPKAWDDVTEQKELQQHRQYDTDFEAYDFGKDSGKMKIFVGIAG